ncbi:MAG: hypothetical protein ACUVRU_09985 [Anaerolineae bacterium]
MWLVAEYEAASLFSLRPRYATSSGGKTLLVPTPFAVKMALLDAACRTLGVSQAEQRWPEICALRVALRPAANAVVSNTFQRILRPYKTMPSPQSPKFDGPFQRTIGYREYVHLDGSFGLALGWDGDDQREWLRDLMIQINYLGKRGSFMQLLGVPTHEGTLPGSFVSLSEQTDPFPFNGTLQMMDDCSRELAFDKVNIYSDTKMQQSDRLGPYVILPYRLKRSSKSFTWYEAFTTP